MMLSSTHQLAMHPAYQQIIGMGPVALEWILQDLVQTGDDWFWALNAITGENPVPAEERGNREAMIRAWVDWARSHDAA
jgi:hypothetical protein